MSISSEVAPPDASPQGAAVASRLRLNIALALLATLMFFNQLDRLLLSTLAEPIRRDLHLSDTQLGLINGLAFAVFYAFFGLPLARLADRFDRPRLLAACLFVWTVATAICGLVTSFVQMLIVRIAVAVGEAGTQPTGHSLLSDYFPPARRASALAIMGIGGSFGSMAALILGGLMGEALGWRATIVIIGLAGMPVAIACLLLMPEPRRAAARLPAGPREPAPGLLASFQELARSPSFVPLAITGTLCLLPGYAAQAWGPAFFMRNFGYTVGEAGLYLGLLTGIGTLVGHLLSGFISDRAARVGPGRVMLLPVITVLLMGPALTASYLAPSGAWGLVLYFIPKVLSIMWFAPVFASIQNSTPPRLRAQASALTLLLSSIFAIGLGPTIVGVISDVLRPRFGDESLRWALIVIANCSVFGSLAAFVSGRALRRAAAQSAAAPA